MNNLYHKVAVASIGIALSFALGANKEVKAATFSLSDTAEFFILNRISRSNGQSDTSFITINDLGFFSFLVANSRNGIEYYQQKGFYEFSISNLSLVKSAIFSIQEDFDPNNPHPYLEISGYIGNGKADLSDFYAGQSLGIQRSSSFERINFDVTQFVNERVSNRDAFVGFAIGAVYPGRASISRTYYAPQFIVETADTPEPVPEPTTLCGSALALGVGGWLKRKKSSQQNKTTSQH
jgi:hypothetical protein